MAGSIALAAHEKHDPAPIGAPDHGGVACFINRLIQPSGASLGAANEVEVLFAGQDAQLAFEKYVAAMGAIVEWETERHGLLAVHAA